MLSCLMFDILARQWCAYMWVKGPCNAFSSARWSPVDYSSIQSKGNKQETARSCQKCRCRPYSTLSVQDIPRPQQHVFELTLFKGELCDAGD